SRSRRCRCCRAMCGKRSGSAATAVGCSWTGAAIPAASGATCPCAAIATRRSDTTNAASKPQGKTSMRTPFIPRLFFTLVLLGLLGVSACRESGGEGEYFAIDGKIFVFNYREARATYLINIVPLRPVEEEQTAVASFENPAGGEPI